MVQSKMSPFSALNVLAVLILFVNHSFSSEANVNTPRGHLMPLGSHTDPDSVPEFEMDGLPTSEQFWKDFVKPSKPAVFRGAAKAFAGFTKWTDEYLVEKYADTELRLEGRKEKFGRTPYGVLGVGRDTLRNFVENYHDPGHKGYIVSELPRTMYHEAGVLPFMACGTFKHRFVETDFWMNGGNASSILHKDAFNTMNCLINGTKEWKLIALKQEKNIYKAWEAARSHGGYSRINVKAVDLLKYPKVAKVPWQYTKLEKGDCLFLPKSMYHNVLSSGTNNVAVAQLFSRFDEYRKRNLDFSDCDNVTKAVTPLSEFIVDWEYPGVGDLSMGNADLENVRSNMLDHVNRAGVFTLKTMIRSVRAIYSEKDTEFAKEFAIKQYKSLTDGAEKLTADMITNFSKAKLRIAAMCFERVDSSNARWHEYHQVSHEAITETLRRYVKKNKGQITREQFMTIYVDGIEGSPVFGKRFFDIIAGEGKQAVTKEELKKNLPKALEKYIEHQHEGEEAATPEVYKNAKRPEKYDEGDVTRVAEEERAERKRRFAEELAKKSDEELPEDQEGEQEEGEPEEGEQEEGEPEEGEPEEGEPEEGEPEEGGEGADGMQGDEELPKPEVVEGNANEQESSPRDEL